MLKRLFGLIALLLGLAGFVAASAVAVAVWPVSRRVADEGEIVVDEVEPEVKFLKEKLAKADTHVQKVSGRIADLKTAARHVEQKGENSDPEDIRKVETAFEELSSTIERAEGLLTAVQGGLAVLTNLDKFSRFIPGATAPQSDTEKSDNLKKIAAAIENLSKDVKEMRMTMENIRNEQDLRKNAGEILKRAERIDRQLSPIAERLHVARRTADSAHTALNSSRDALDYLRLEIPLVVTLIFAWIALAQASLTIHGWKLLSGRHAPPPVAEA